MAENKVTRKDLFNWILAVLDEGVYDEEDALMADAAKTMCYKYIETLSRKPKPRVNKEAIEFAAAVRATLEAGEPGRVWMAKDVAEAMEVSSHKAAAALRRLTGDGVVVLCDKAHKNDANSYVLAAMEGE